MYFRKLSQLNNKMELNACENIFASKKEKGAIESS